jgi:hypothetical protein
MHHLSAAALMSWRCLPQCIMKATVANQSEFSLSEPPPIRVVFSGEDTSSAREEATWRFQPGDEKSLKHVPGRHLSAAPAAPRGGVPPSRRAPKQYTRLVA